MAGPFACLEEMRCQSPYFRQPAPIAVPVVKIFIEFGADQS